MKELCKNFLKNSVYIAFACIVFLLFTNFIFIIRTVQLKSNIMPNLLGKKYIDIHNDLTKLKLRIQLQKKSYVNLPEGIVLAQNLAPQSQITEKTRLILTINQPAPFLNMPSLANNSLRAVKQILESIPYEDENYPLKLAHISYIKSDKHPSSIVLAQFPPPETKILPQSPVYLLVNARNLQEKLSKKKFENQNIALASKWLNENNIAYRITLFQKTLDKNKEGQIIQAKWYASKKRWHFSVYAYEKPELYQNAFENIEVTFPELSSTCNALQYQPNNKVTAPHVFFHSTSHEPKEKVKLIFYRQEEQVVEVQCEERKKTIYRKTFTPKEFKI